MIKKIKYYYVYDSSYRGYDGNCDPTGFPYGNSIYHTLDKENVERILNIINPIAEKERKLTLLMGEKELVLDEIDIKNMSDEDIIKWIKNK